MVRGGTVKEWGHIVFWIMLGFFSGVLFTGTTLGNYERPSKWEDGGTISHQGKTYRLQAIESSSEKK